MNRHINRNTLAPKIKNVRAECEFNEAAFVSSRETAISFAAIAIFNIRCSQKPSNHKNMSWQYEERIAYTVGIWWTTSKRRQSKNESLPLLPVKHIPRPKCWRTDPKRFLHCIMPCNWSIRTLAASRARANELKNH